MDMKNIEAGSRVWLQRGSLAIAKGKPGSQRKVKAFVLDCQADTKEMLIALAQDDRLATVDPKLEGETGLYPVSAATGFWQAPIP